MSMTPLTHHDILDIVEPFTRQGRHVDLAASDRAARLLVFKPVERPGAGPDEPALCETLRLACREDGRYTLTRVLDHPAGLQATLQCAGTDRAALLARVDAIAPGLAFRQGPGWWLACNYEFESNPKHLPAAGAPPEAALVLTRGELKLDALTLVITLMAVKGVAGDLALTPAHGERLDLPEDVLAVQGWDWARLVPATDGWTSKLRLRGDHLRRSRTAERALEQVADHLTRVLAEPPARYHQRHVWARWGVVFRRLIPTLTAAMLIIAALLLPRLTRQADAGWLMALHYVPIAVLAFSFTLQELPRFELPRWPRRPSIAQWRRGGRQPSPEILGHPL
jgi:hypothetical protein